MEGGGDSTNSQVESFETDDDLEKKDAKKKENKMTLNYLKTWAMKRKKNSKLKFDFMPEWGRFLFFRYLISLVVEGYMEWCIAVIMNVTEPVETYNGDSLGTKIAWVSLILVYVITPMF